MSDPPRPPTDRPAEGHPSGPPRDASVAALLKALRRHLPEPPAEVLVLPVGSGPGADLRREGYTVREEALPIPRLGGEGVVTASAPGVAAVAVSVPAGAEPGELFRALRPRIGAGGRLLVVAPGPTGVWSATRALGEEGFAVLDDEDLPGPPGGAVLLVARPARHRVRPYREGDEDAILDLFSRAFHHSRSLERWRWEYAENPFGNHRISVAVDEEGRLLAHYAGYPVRFWSDAGLAGSGPRTLSCLQIGDTMTAPEARRIGRRRTSLLTRTVQHFYAAWCHGRVAFNFGANTGKIQRFSRRTAGARRLEAVPFHARPLPGPRFPAPMGRAALLGGWRVERADGFDERFDALWRRCRGAYGLLVQRDRRYLAWRYATPGVAYFVWTVSRWGRLVGWSVFRQEAPRPEAREGEPAGERLIWGDALFDPRYPRAPAVLLSRVASDPVHRRARSVEGWLTGRPAWWGRIVRDLGFRPEPEPEDLGFVYVPFEVDPAEAFARHLYYTKGDTDLF